MRVADFHFELPEELIAQHPPAVRGASRMLVLERRPAPEAPVLTDSQFNALPAWLRAGDVLVLNDSRVLPARLFAVRAGVATQVKSPAPSGRVEVLLTEQVAEGSDSSADEKKPVSERPGSDKYGDSGASLQNDGQPEKTGRTTQVRDAGRGGLVWRALCRPAKKVVLGERLLLFEQGAGAGDTPVLTAEVVGKGFFGERTLQFAPVEDFYGVVSRIGHMPLPPYIHRDQAHASAQDKAEDYEAEDRARYQTVYAQDPRVAPPASAAAPTAGLHFTPEMLDRVRARGVEIAYVTLHVGLGTFQPVRVEDLADIRLHAERYTLPAATADAINRARAGGRRVIAVGTTTTRTLEHAAEQAAGGLLEPHSGSTSIFLAPGHRFRVISGLLTNFHLPESTLIMLVAALAANRPLPGGSAGLELTDGDMGRRDVLGAYAHAVQERYRFFSYGDCMLVV